MPSLNIVVGPTDLLADSLRVTLAFKFALSILPENHFQGGRFLDQLHDLNFKKITPEHFSTNGGSRSDFAFSNMTSKTRLKAGYFENVFSYHKLVWLIAKKH